MIAIEVTSMENEHEFAQKDVQDGYVPRPKWQVWGARAAVVIFIFLVILQILWIARGGL